MLATVTSKGQITLPKSIRDQLAITTGTQLDFAIVDGVIQARPINRSVKDIFGMLKKPSRKAISPEAMDEAIAEAASARFEAADQHLPRPDGQPT
ncbi:MAG: AbrB/MazE/SpoVT family DNA-binding domain-containing protein [Lautropia sp.]|nr:AbrB/MazE/SpoVT family DNA-binding domain-containing protein [Lautropia sp.]